MTFDEYQKRTGETAIYPKDVAVAYCALGLAGEAGEVANRVKKIYRDNRGVLSFGSIQTIAEEVGDTLWYCSQLATEIGVPLERIAEMNLDKLASRKQRGTLQGSGDKR